MRRFLPKTFFGQLVLGTVLVQTLCLGAFILYTVISQKDLAQQRTQQRIVQQLSRLEAVCSRHLANGDMAGVQEALELARISPTIDVARLTDLSGKTLAVTGNGGNGLDPYELAALPRATQQQVFQIKNGQTEAVTPVMEGARPVALLWLEPNRAVALNTVNILVRISMSYGGFALLANLLPIFLITRSMTRPLRRLGEATRVLIRNPDLNAGFPLPVTTSNEAGQLTTSFNTMVRELEEQRSGLLETLALLDSMLENAPIGFAFYDRDLRYVRLNQFLADIHGKPIAQHLSMRIGDFYPAYIATEKEANIARVFETGTAIRNVELSGEMPQGSGHHRSWLMHFYPVRTQGDRVRWVGVIVIEVTERLKTEEALRKTERLATAGRLAASIAHEINNPLESVTNLLYLLETHESLDEAAMQYVRTAGAELARVSEITQQTLRFYRQTSFPARTNVTEVLDSIVTLYQARIHSLQVTVHKKYGEQVEVFGFGGELRQLFANLIGNALDAMPKGGKLLLRARCGCGRAADGTWRQGARVSVSDTGTGMSEETVRRIFEAFFTTKQATGTGLGLWVSEEIIRKHSGTVRVRSRQGAKSGTTFMMFFPNSGLLQAQATSNDSEARSE